MKALKINIQFLLVLTSFSTAFPRLALAQSGWQRTTDYTNSGYQFDPVEAGGRIYVAGGFNGVASSNVFFSAINANASLADWTAGTSLPEADRGPGVAVADGWIYVALGSGHVLRAPIQAGGGLGAWIAETSVEPSVSYDTSLKAYKGYLYLFGRYDGSYHNVIRFAPIHSDGSLGPWSTGSLPVALNRQSVQIYNDRAYLVGGITTGNNVLGFSYSSPVRTNGALGAWRQEATLPTPLWYQASVLANDQIFLFGGATNTTTTSQVNTVYKGAINPTNGTIENWVLTDSTPTIYNTGPGAVYVPANGNAYLIGGVSLGTDQFSNQVWRKGLGPTTNHPPVANPQTLSVAANTALSITLTASDEDNDALTFLLTSLPTNGILSGTAPNLSYLPNQNFSGGDSFNFKVNDGQADSAIATVSINVLPVTNHAPVAQIIVSPLLDYPGVTEPLVIAGRDGQATVVLDGSQSSDADGDSLSFRWLEDANTLGSRSVLTASFDIGPHTIHLIVSDGKDTGTNSLTLEVISAADAAELLTQLVQHSSLPSNRKNPLLASVRAAAACFDREHFVPGVNQLRAFQNKLQAQVGRINQRLACDLNDFAQQIIEALK